MPEHGMRNPLGIDLMAILFDGTNHPTAAQVVELPAGTLARTDTRAGDEVGFEV